MVEKLSVLFSRRLKRYWRRGRYVEGKITRKNMKVVTLGGKRKRSWKLRAIPKLRWRLKIVSPIKLLAKFRDAYIDMMLGWAGNEDRFFGNGRIPMARKVEVKTKDEDFETKLIFEIYKSLAAAQ